MNLKEAAAHLTQAVGVKTLAEFRDEADREATGTVYETLRVKGGPRLVLLMCLTDPDQIAILERVFNFVDDGLGEDWTAMTLADVISRTVRGEGFSFEALRDEYGRRSAVVLCSFERASIENLNVLFGLPA